MMGSLLSLSSDLAKGPASGVGLSEQEREREARKQAKGKRKSGVWLWHDACDRIGGDWDCLVGGWAGLSSLPPAVLCGLMLSLVCGLPGGGWVSEQSKPKRATKRRTNERPSIILLIPHSRLHAQTRDTRQPGKEGEGNQLPPPTHQPTPPHDTDRQTGKQSWGGRTRRRWRRRWPFRWVCERMLLLCFGVGFCVWLGVRVWGWCVHVSACLCGGLALCEGKGCGLGACFGLLVAVCGRLASCRERAYDSLLARLLSHPHTPNTP